MSTDAKWRNYEAALLEVMGCNYSPYPEYWWWYRFLFIPSFAAPSCLIISGNDREGELHFATLKEQHFDIFEATYLAKETYPEDLEIWRLRKCWETMELLTNAEVQLFRQQLETIQPMSLPDLKFMGRDGIIIHCWCQERNKKHTFKMSQLSDEQVTKYKLLLLTSFQLLKRHIKEAFWQQYLVENLPFYELLY